MRMAEMTEAGIMTTVTKDTNELIKQNNTKGAGSKMSQPLLHCIFVFIITLAN